MLAMPLCLASFPPPLRDRLPRGAFQSTHFMANVTEIRKGMASIVKQPMFEGGSQIKALEPDRFHAVVGYPLKKAGEVPPQWTYLDSEKIKPLTNLSNDVTLAARNSLIAMLEWLQKTKGLTKDQAFVVTSVACDLRISNVVDVPNYAVTTICPMEIFDAK